MDADRDVGDVGIQEVQFCFLYVFPRMVAFQIINLFRLFFFLDFFWGGGFRKNSSNLYVARTLDGFFLGIRTKSLGFFHEVSSTRMKGGLKSPRKHDSTKESSPR